MPDSSAFGKEAANGNLKSLFMPKNVGFKAHGKRYKFVDFLAIKWYNNRRYKLLFAVF